MQVGAHGSSSIKYIKGGCKKPLGYYTISNSFGFGIPFQTVIAP